MQGFLEDNSRVVGESEIYRGRKTVLLEQKYGTGLKLLRYVCLQFSSNGLAEVTGIFNNPKNQIKKQLADVAFKILKSKS